MEPLWRLLQEVLEGFQKGLSSGFWGVEGSRLSLNPKPINP